jgi:hypothetical protein
MIYYFNNKNLVFLFISYSVSVVLLKIKLIWKYDSVITHLTIEFQFIDINSLTYTLYITIHIIMSAAYERHLKREEAKLKQFHDNQISSGKEIVNHFVNGIRYVQLAAQMQSGKTGCAMYVACQMLLNKQIDVVYIISGSSETELRDQWETKIDSHIEEYITDNGLSKEQIRHLFVSIKLVWRQDLKKEFEDFDTKYLIIWDESHFASTEDQTLHHFFEVIGLMSAIQGDTTCLESKNSYLLSVTATRCAEASRAVGKTSDGIRGDDPLVGKWKLVVMRPGEAYTGVVKLNQNGLIQKSCVISEDTIEHLTSILDKYVEQKKYMVMRCCSVNELILEGIAKTLEIDVVYYNMKTKGTGSNHSISISMLMTPPTKFTIFVIRGMLRMGKELPKQNVCAVYESSKKSNHNTILQGLLGRVCGYHSEKIEVYLSPDFIDGGGLDEYEAIVKSDFKIGLSGTSHVSKRNITKLSPTGLSSNVPIHVKANDGWNPLAVKHNGDNRMVFGWLLEKIRDNEIDLSGYSDEQRLEINDRLKQPEIVIDPKSEEISKPTNVFNRHNTHFLSGKQIKDTDVRVKEMAQAIETKIPITRGGWNSVIVWYINGNFPDYPMFKKGDCIVTFSTEAKHPRFRPFEGDDVLKSNGKSLWDTELKPSTDEKMNGVSGGQLHQMDSDTYTNVDLFKITLVEAITESIDTTKSMIVGKQLTSNHCAGKKYKGISFSKDCYTLESLRTIFSEIGDEHDVSIKMDIHYKKKFTIKTSQHTEGSSDIRIKRIYWE